jgi:hypothetical protein
MIDDDEPGGGFHRFELKTDLPQGIHCRSRRKCVATLRSASASRLHLGLAGVLMGIGILPGPAGIPAFRSRRWVPKRFEAAS